MRLKSYKSFKNCEWNVFARELLENWKTLARDVNTIPLCSTLEHALAQAREQQTLCFVSSDKLFFKTPRANHRLSRYEISELREICYNISPQKIGE